MEYLDFPTVKQFLSSDAPPTSEKILAVGRAIGSGVSMLHVSNIIHGDLTTSNILWCDAAEKTFWIDFGLAAVATMDEDKAVDLYVLERSIASSHPGMFEPLVSSMIAGYRETYSLHMSDVAQVMRTLEDVRLRGRKKSMLG